MIAALVTGSLFKPPESRTSKAGKEFVSATITCPDGNSVSFVRVVAFNEAACAELLRLEEGESLSAQGRLSAELYKPEGREPQVSLNLIADHVLAARQPKKERT